MRMRHDVRLVRVKSFSLSLFHPRLPISWLPRKHSPCIYAGNQRLASNQVGKGGLRRSRSGKSRSISPPSARLFSGKPASQPTLSHFRPLSVPCLPLSWFPYTEPPVRSRVLSVHPPQSRHGRQVSDPWLALLDSVRGFSCSTRARPPCSTDPNSRTIFPPVKSPLKQKSRFSATSKKLFL